MRGIVACHQDIYATRQMSNGVIAHVCATRGPGLRRRAHQRPTKRFFQQNTLSRYSFAAECCSCQISFPKLGSCVIVTVMRISAHFG